MKATHRRGWIKVPSMLAASGWIIALAAGATGTSWAADPALGLSPVETKAAVVICRSQAAPIQFAAREIRSALDGAGWPAPAAEIQGAVKIVLAEPDGEGPAESFAITFAAGERQLTIRGTDARGLMYGGLAIAEQVSLGADPARMQPQQGNAFLAVRGLKFNIPFPGNVYVAKEDQERGDWFYDLEFWRSFIRFLAYHRYNLLTFWNSHPFDRMVRLRKYPEANGIPEEELRRNIAFFHKLFGLARDCGIDTSLVTWNIHCSPAFQKAHGVKDGQDSPLIRVYQKECIKELLAEYPELTGLGTCPGEFMGGTADWREDWIRATYFAGIAESGRSGVPFIHRYWGSEPAATAAMLTTARYPGPVYLDIKFNGEHMYSSPRFHVQDRAWLDQHPMPYKLLWHLRNDCIFQLRWGDPAFTADMVRNCAGPNSAGFVMGSEIEVPGVDRNHTEASAAHKTWQYEFEKNWARMGIWGRMGYNPDEPQSYWIAHYSKRFGQAAGPLAFAAIQAASKIIPMTTSFHWNYMNGDWYPEANIGSWNTSFEVPFPNYRDGQYWHNVLEWIFTHTIDDGFQNIPDFVADAISGVTPPSSVVTPRKFADRLEQLAAEVRQLRAEAARQVSAEQGEWACTEMDLRALEALGRYYAAKARGATELMFFLATGGETNRSSAVAQLEQAEVDWKQLTEITSAHYRTHEVFLFGQFDWQRYTAEADKDIQIGRELSAWQSGEQAWDIKSADRPIKSHVWQADLARYKAWGPWVSHFNTRVAKNLARNIEVAGPLNMSTSVTSAKNGIGILSIGAAGISSARINRQEAKIIGQSPNQFIIAPLIAGDNKVELTTTGRMESLPILSLEQVLDSDAFFVEAESGEITRPMAVQAQAGASGGEVLCAPKGKGRGADAAGKLIENGKITYQIKIPKSGRYTIQALAWWNDTSANSFYYAWDTAEPKILGNDELYQRWHFIQTQPELLAAGPHTLTIRNRDEGSVMDCFLVAYEDALDVKSMLDGYYERLSAPHHLRFPNAGAWEQRRTVVRQQTLASLGLDPMPERLPLKVHYGGTLDRDGYVLRRVYFQTWPDFYASGWLYLPKTPGRHPGILNPHGHWVIGARHPVVQSRCITLVKKGYVALSVDTVHLPAESYLLGANSIGVMTFNNIRGIDLLESLPEVDATRIGCTGESGGGQQTMYLMAIDDRIKAAVPAVLVTYFRRIMDPNGFPHCICNIVPDLVRESDEPEVSATFAPKPALYLAVTGDWTKLFPKEEFPEIRGIYKLYDAETKVGCFQWESGHDYSQPMREKMYAFFNHYLQDNDDAAAAQEAPVAVETLETLNNLDRQPAGARPLESILDWYRAKCAIRISPPGNIPASDAQRRDIRIGLATLVGDKDVRGRTSAAAQPVNLAGITGCQMTIASEPGIEFPVWLMGARQTIGDRLVVMIHPEGKTGILKDYAELIRTLQSNHIPMLIPEIRLTGMLKRKWDLDAILWGRPEIGQAVTDLRACLDVMSPSMGSNERRIALVGLGDSGITAIMAGALEPRFTAVVADRLGTTYRAGRSAPLIANILRVGDIPEWVAAVAPRPCALAGVAPEQFSFARASYQARQSESALTLREAPLSSAELGSQVLGQLSAP